MKDLGLPPQNIELEKIVLGSILLQPKITSDVINLINEDVFYLEKHKIIYRAIISLYDNNNGIDILTVFTKLQNTNNEALTITVYDLTTITNNVTSVANIETHCKQLIELWLMREYAATGMEMYRDGMGNTEDVFLLYDKANNKLSDVQDKALKGAIKGIDYYTMQVYEDYERVKAHGVLGISTGLKSWDDILNGLVQPDLIILAARPGAGKTSLAMSITHNTSILNNVPVAWFSLEMDGSQLIRKLASIDANIPHEQIRKGSIPKEHELKFFDSLNKISSSPIYIEDKAAINVRHLRTRLNVLKQRNKVKYAIVDYLQLMSGVETKNKNRENIISEISRGLKQIAKELEMPILALSQLSREVEKRTDKMPQLSDLRESGAIEQDADSVVFLMRPEYYGFTQPVEINGTEYSARGLCVAKVAKNRHGSCGTFPLQFVGETMKFQNNENYTGGYSPPGNYRPVSETQDETPF